MKGITFVFVSVYLLVMSMGEYIIDLDSSVVNITCMSLILLFGIPHGAIDNILFLSTRKVSTYGFFFIYICVVLLNVAIWTVLPEVAFLIFLILSAFHFGESQLSQYVKGKTRWEYAIYTVWGFFLLLGFLTFNFQELNQLAVQYSEYELISYVVANYDLLVFASCFTGLSLFGFFTYLLAESIIRLESVIVELMILGLLFFSFHLFNFLVGFTLYFLVLHSLRVLLQEFQYLKKRRIVIGLTQFVKKLLPLSLVSFVGIILIFGAIYFKLLTISYSYVVLVIIATITVPHVYVMSVFYRHYPKST
mgnify:CR=1 FL=1